MASRNDPGMLSTPLTRLAGMFAADPCDGSKLTGV